MNSYSIVLKGILSLAAENYRCREIGIARDLGNVGNCQ